MILFNKIWMNPKGDGARRRALLAKKIFTSLTLLQILSNSGLAFACFSFKSCPEGISFLPCFLLCPGIKEKSAFAPTSIEKADPVSRIGSDLKISGTDCYTFLRLQRKLMNFGNQLHHKPNDRHVCRLASRWLIHLFLLVCRRYGIYWGTGLWSVLDHRHTLHNFSFL